MSDHYYLAAPPHFTPLELPLPIDIVEVTRPPKRIRHDEDVTGYGDLDQDETNVNVAPVGPQTKNDKGKRKKLGRPQKGCEE